MLELLVCSVLTILPDYLFRHYVQGKRIGHEITLFSVWYELRWGITGCAILTTSLIATVFYYHPSAVTVSSYFRTVTILPEAGGRVTEIYVVNNQAVQAGDPIFRLDSTRQQAAVDTARSKVNEVNAAIEVSDAQIHAAEAGVEQAQAAYDLVEVDYLRNKELLDKGSPAANPAEVERQANRLHEREGQLEAAQANLEAVSEQVTVLLPAQKASAEAALEQAEVELDKTLIVAGVSGRIEQFSLQVGDFVNPLLRPAGILVPATAGRDRFQAGFHQLSAQVIRPGMVAEISCLSKPFTVIPMVIVAVQDVIPSGQLRPTDRLQDLQDNQRPGTVTAFLEPLYAGLTDDLPPGSTCLANAYTSNHDRLHDETLGTGERVFLHVVDTVGFVHAFLLRLQVLLLPVRELVFAGGH